MRIDFKPIAFASFITLLIAAPALAESRDFDLAPFNAIDASTGIAVHVQPGNTQAVRVEAKESAGFEHLELSVRGSTLIASTDYSFLDFIFDGGLLGSVLRNGPNLEVYVTIPGLERVEASSGADVDINEMSGENLRAGASSGGDINLNSIAYESIALSASSGADIDATGTCISVSGNVSSGAEIDGTRLECVNARANASSGGRIVLSASQSLDANASSGGDITIVGNPQRIDVNTSSGGDVHIRQ